MKNFKIIFFTLIILFTMFITALFSYYIAEPKAYDFLTKNVLTQRLPFDKNKNVYGHDDILLVIIDDKSVEKYDWPWKKELSAKVLKYFNEYTQAKVIIHDAIVTNKDTNNPESNKIFFDTLEKMNNLVEGIAFSTTKYSDENYGTDYDKFLVYKFSIKNIDLKTDVPLLYTSTIISPEDFLFTANNVGSVTMLPGFLDGNWSMLYTNDETFRNSEYFINYKGYIMPSLAANAFLLLNNNPKIVINKNYIEFPELNYKIKYKKTPYQIIVPTKFYKMHTDGYTHRKYSAIDIIDSYDLIKQGKKPIIEPSVFKDKIVIFGANVKAGNGLNDIKKTPISTNQSGADIQATYVDNIVHKDFLKVMPEQISILLILFNMVCIFYIISTKEIIKALIYCFLFIAGILLISVTCFYFNIIVPVITFIIMAVYTMMVAYINRYITEENKKEKVTNALGKYMSEDVMKSVLKNIDNLGLGGKKAIVTVLFSDIRGFTSMSEKMSAQEVSQLLNEYFSAMEPIVTKYNGIINKFIGDAVMAVFGEPIQDEKHPDNAVKCACEMLQYLEKLNIKWKSEGKSVINIGIGINTGEVFIGNIGSEKRMEYTVIGDTVNLASRLESYNKTYKTKILISSTTYASLKEYTEVNEISDVEIRGKSEKMNIYEVKSITNSEI